MGQRMPKGELAEARNQWKEALQLYSDAYWVWVTD